MQTSISISGVTTFSQGCTLLPSVQVTISYGAELNIQTGANLYVYDADEWRKGYVRTSNDRISPVAYSPSVREAAPFPMFQSM